MYEYAVPLVQSSSDNAFRYPSYPFQKCPTLLPYRKMDFMLLTMFVLRNLFDIIAFFRGLFLSPTDTLQCRRFTL